MEFKYTVEQIGRWTKEEYDNCWTNEMKEYEKMCMYSDPHRIALSDKSNEFQFKEYHQNVKSVFTEILASPIAKKHLESFFYEKEETDFGEFLNKDKESISDLIVKE